MPLRSGVAAPSFLALVEEGLRNPRLYTLLLFLLLSVSFSFLTFLFTPLGSLSGHRFRSQLHSPATSLIPLYGSQFVSVADISPEICRSPADLRTFRTCMASALLASRNEPCWGERKVYMRKNPNSNPHLKSKPNPNPNKLIHDHHHHHHHPSKVHGRQADESAVSVPTISDDSSSLNRKSISLSNRRESSTGGYVTFNITAYSRNELKDLKKRLISELEQVRRLTNQIESREIQSRSGYSASQLSGGGGGGYGAREVTSSTTSTRPPPALQVNKHSSLDSPPFIDSTKEKRTPKANQYYRPSEFVMGKEKAPRPDGKKVSGTKRPLPLVSGRDPKRPALDPEMGKLLSSIMNRCGQILSKLMKHKPSWIFNIPVDVVGMGLHDYNQIIKHPMDLGTVKNKLDKNLYASPLDFASDVRLTFNNALVYNPKGHDVHAMAEQLLARFEDMFEPAYKKFHNIQRRGSSWSGAAASASMSEVVVAAAKKKKPDPIAIPIAVTTASNPTPVQTPAPTTSGLGLTRLLSTGRSTTGKQPKPKAKDTNKREMSFEEKQKLGMNLQNLPQEKMDQVLHIIKRRNANVAQHGDEIELDIEVLDTETLWDLDRFVCNIKKMMSKIKRQAFVTNNNQIPAATQGSSKSPPVAEMHEAPKAIPAEPTTTAKKVKKGETVEEDVDIGEDMPTNNFPPVEIEKDAGGGYASRSSSSSSSSSGSSSSSDSDSGSTSGSDSDGDDAQSPFMESKASPRTKEE